MASGNMGDLEFSLTLKSRIEDETRKVIQELNKVDASGKRAQEALTAIAEAVRSIDGMKHGNFEKFHDILSKIAGEIAVFNSEDFFDPKKVRQLESVQAQLMRIDDVLSRIVSSGKAGDNIFPNNVATEVNNAKKSIESLDGMLAKLYRKEGDGLNILGVKDTDDIRQATSVLSKYRSELEQIRNNGGSHPISGLTASDITKSSEYINAINIAKIAIKELDNQMKASVEEEKKNEQKVEEILQRRAHERQRVADKEAEIERQKQERLKVSAQIAQEEAKSEIKWNEQKGKAFSDALQRQMKASVEEEKKRQVSLFSGGFDTSVLEKRIQMLNRMKEIQEKLSYYQPKAQYAWLDYESSLKFGNANTPTLRHKEDELQRLRTVISDLEAEFNKLGGNDAFKNVDNQIKNLEQTIARLKESGGALNLGKMLGLENKSTDEFRIAKEAAMATEAHVKRQNELTTAFEKYYRIQEQVKAAEERLAAATARTNQARREAIAASRQQAESLVRDRIKELEAQRQQLQGLFGSGKSVLDKQELLQISQAFSQITQELNTLRGAMSNIGSYSIKELFSMSRGTNNYAPLVGSMDTTIKKKQEAIELERKHQEEIARTAAKARNDLASAFAKANEEAKKMQGIVGDIKSLFLQGGLVFGAQQFFNSIVQTGGEIVQQHVALRSILGDVQKADELFAQTQQLALQSPFKFGELNRDVKQLAAFGVEANDLYDTAKRLADIASGLGVSFERLGLAYGQVKARSWLDGKELRQFAYAGLPLLQRITELYNAEGKNGRNNYTQADVKKMISGRQVSFEDVQKVLWNMTNEGGQFYNMQLVLSETLLGRWNKLIDAWDIMLGKFAEGKSIIGGTFSFAINRVTDLVLALDKLSPAVISFGAVFAARKLGGFAASKIGMGSLAANYSGQTNAQLKSYSIAQQQLVVEGKISQEVALQNIYKRAGLLADRETIVASYNQLALEGRMSVIQMQRAVKEGLVSKEIIKQLVLMGQITAKQEQIILNGGRMSAMWSMTTSKMGGILSALGGWWGIAITAVTSLLMGYSQWSSRVKEEEKTLVDGAKQKSQKYGDFLSGLGPKNDTNLSSQVDSMKEVLKSSNDYTDSIKQQVEGAGSLSKQYDILKKKIEEAKEINEGLGNKYGSVVNSATAATGLVNDRLFNDLGLDTPEWMQWLGGLFNDDIAKNVEQAQEALSKFQVMFDELDTNTKSKMENFIKTLMENNSELAEQIKNLPLAEQVRMLAAIGGDDWDTFVAKFAAGSKETEDWMKELADRAKSSSDDVSEIMYDDIPKGLDSVRKQLGMSQDDFKAWAKKNPELFASMMDAMAQKANITSKTILYYFHSAISNLMNLDFWPDDNGDGKKNKPTYNSGVNTPFAELIRQRLHDNGTFSGTKKKGKFWTREVDTALKSVQDQSFQTTGENIQKELKKARNELDVMNTGKVDKKSAAYQKAKSKYELWKAIANAGGISDDLGKNKVTGNYGKDGKNSRQEDKELKALQARVSLYKKLYSEIKKYKDLFGNGALGQLANDGEFEAIFGDKKHFPLSDYTNYGTSIKELLATLPANTTDRKNFVNSEKAGIQTEDRKLLAESRSEELTILNNQLSVIQEQYETYKKIYELTGNKKGAENVAFGGTVQFDSYKKFLEEQLRIAVAHDNVQSGLNLSASDVRGMDLENVKDKYGKESRTYDIRKQLDDEDKKIKSETIALLTDIIEKNATISQQIEDENRKYERQLELIENIEDPQMKQRAKDGAEKSHNETTAKLQFEQFKDNSDWVTIFDDLNRVSSSTINSMIGKIDDFSKTTGLSVEVVKQLRDALGKLRSEQIERNPIEGIVGGMQRGNAIGSFIGSRFRKGMDVSTTTYVDSKNAKKMGVKEGNYTKGQLENEQKGAYDDANKGVAGLASKFKALQDCLSPVITLFDTLGMEDTVVGQGTEMASNALGAASQVSSGLSSLGLSSLGPYGAAAGAALSVVSSIAAMHDKSLQKEIEASEARQKEMENLTKNVKSVIESTLGGVYSYKATDSTKQSIKDAYSGLAAKQEYANSGGVFSRAVKLSEQETKALKDLKAALDNPDNAYQSQLASLQAQKVELETQKSLEESKKKSDDTKIADYKQEIIEMEQQISTFKEDFLKDIYSIDMKSWASELTDAVVSAWQNGENAVDAYKDKVKDMVKDLTKNIISQKYIEKLMKKPLETLTNYLDTHNGTLDEGVILDFANQVSALADEAAPTITKIFDALKNAGLDLRENGSSSTTNSVKSITEDTADLLASYLNAIRLDVSVNREYIKTICDAVKVVPDLSVIARSQLTAMNQLVTLAEYRNGVLDDMYSWMKSVTYGTGTKSIKMN